MRNSILLLGLLFCSSNTFADWQAKAVVDSSSEMNQYSLRASDNFPNFTLSCINIDALPIDMVQIDRLTTIETKYIERVEIQVDGNPVMIFYPDQHKIIFAFKYHPSIESGIETVTMIPASDTGEIQYADLIGQLIEGINSTARVITDAGPAEVNFSLTGFTSAYLPMRTACLENKGTIAVGE